MNTTDKIKELLPRLDADTSVTLAGTKVTKTIAHHTYLKRNPLPKEAAALLRECLREISTLRKALFAETYDESRNTAYEGEYKHLWKGEEHNDQL